MKEILSQQKRKDIIQATELLFRRNKTPDNKMFELMKEINAYISYYFVKTIEDNENSFYTINPLYDQNNDLSFKEIVRINFILSVVNSQIGKENKRLKEKMVKN